MLLKLTYYYEQSVPDENNNAMYDDENIDDVASNMSGDSFMTGK